MVNLRLKIRTCISPIFTHQISSQKSTKHFAMTWKLFLVSYAFFFFFLHSIFVCLFVCLFLFWKKTVEPGGEGGGLR